MSIQVTGSRQEMNSFDCNGLFISSIKEKTSNEPLIEKMKHTENTEVQCRCLTLNDEEED